MPFLPVNKEDMIALGWDRPDFIFVSGDAYVDHPSFGPAIISRVLEKQGFRVAILAQPDWKTTADFKRFGRPKLGFLVSSGNIDSMVNHYTANKKKRSQDAYSPGGKAGMRPDRATIVYCNRIREAYSNIPVIIGGVEASLRRFAHYDYWDNAVRRSILTDSGANLLVYGMGELAIEQIAKLLERGVPVENLRAIPGTCCIVPSAEEAGEVIRLQSFDEIKTGGRAFAEAFRIEYEQQDAMQGKRLLQMQDKYWLVQNPPSRPLTQSELDEVYELPYMRTWHPSYTTQGGVPAITEVEFSLLSSRGCFGGCSFCALHFHQGRVIQARSHESILREAAMLTTLPGFKGYIHDVGGPTANFRKTACAAQAQRGACSHRQCLHPSPCKNLQADHSDYLELLRKLRALPGIKKVFIRSGLRFDYLLLDPKASAFLKELCLHHVSGQLKVAPEHVSPKVLRAMGKPDFSVYRQFMLRFQSMNEQLGMEQYLVPYFISSHPGSDLAAAIELAESMRDLGIHPEQVQDFYPTPGTVSTCMYFTGLDPRTLSPVHVPQGEERRMQRALLQYHRRENHSLVRRALVQAGREDLIGGAPKCLVPSEGSEYWVAKPDPKGGHAKKAAPKPASATARSATAGHKEGKPRRVAQPSGGAWKENKPKRNETPPGGARKDGKPKRSETPNGGGRADNKSQRVRAPSGGSPRMGEKPGGKGT